MLTTSSKDNGSRKWKINAQVITEQIAPVAHKEFKVLNMSYMELAPIKPLVLDETCAMKWHIYLRKSLKRQKRSFYKFWHTNRGVELCDSHWQCTCISYDQFLKNNDDDLQTIDE